jgi:23S rRNA A2030 N6-methylase RlmJ
MPREQINFERSDLGRSDDVLLHVNWLNSPEGTGHVQVSFEVSEQYLGIAMESLNGGAQDGSSLLWSPVLSRHEINRMIRALRRGRDQAYGKDE